MIFTFYAALGHNIGSSLIEKDYIPYAKKLIDQAAAKGVKLHLPLDVVIAKSVSTDSIQTVSHDSIPDGYMGLDIGPETIQFYKQELAMCKTIVWNGPMGVFENSNFSKGTYEIAHILASITDNGGTTIIGGGDSVAAINNADLSTRMTHISTGGGASLEMLEGKVLPGVACLDDA